MNNIKKLLVVFGVLLSSSFHAQDNNKSKDSIKDRSNYIEYDDFIIFEGDTLMIQLEELQILKKLRFKTKKDRRYYFWLRKKVFNAYPYAMMTQVKLEVINTRLKNIKSKSKRKRYTKRLQKHFEKELTSQLKNLTLTEGRILIKLIHRQTGSTSYDLLKTLRSNWKAYWSDKKAKIFKLTLKEEYHPESVNEDMLIEEILQRAFNNNKLKRQRSKLDFDYGKISRKEGKFIKIIR